METEKINRIRGFASHQLHEIILPWWTRYMPDEVHGGFIGRRDHYNRPVNDFPKGVILHARILWTFSAVYRYDKKETYRRMAERAYHYLLDYFKDTRYGGYLWSVIPDGTSHNSKKQTYAQAFVMYGMTEYAEATGTDEALQEALSLFELIESKALDDKKNGYLEAFSREWSDTGDLRLSDIDMNEKKTMNTHLHVIEAYARLYRIHKDEKLEAAVMNLLDIFERHIINHHNHHLNLFFDEDWNLKSGDISFGHDIEASWLLQEAAEIMGDGDYVKNFRSYAKQLTDAVVPAIIPAGGLIHENHFDRTKNNNQLEWWAQAEAIIGFLNVYRHTGEQSYLDRAVKLCDYIDRVFTDRTNGEWYYRVNEEGQPVTEYEKAGFWKCPYHTARMCLEVLENFNPQT